MGSFKIWVKDMPRYIIMEVLKKMGEDGIRWWSDGALPTTHIPAQLFGFLVKGGSLTYYGGFEDDYELFTKENTDEVSVDEYLYGVTKENFDCEAFLELISATK